MGAADGTGAADDRLPAVRQPSTVPMILRYLTFQPEPCVLHFLELLGQRLCQMLLHGNIDGKFYKRTDSVVMEERLRDSCGPTL